MGNRFYDRDTYLQFASTDETSIVDHVPAMVYTIAIHPKEGILLVKNRDRFTIPERRYGYHNKFYNTITSSYDPLMPSNGLIADGLKGAGKSMLAEDIGNFFINSGRPVFLIDQKLPWQAIRNVIASVGPCCVYFDEFGKVYNKREERAAMLPLFSDSELRGVFWIVTANNSNELSEYMIDRPGRFLWRISYNYIPVAMGLEIANDLHVPEALLPTIALYVHNYAVSFDVVRRLCLTAATSKTLEELTDKVSVLNIPPIAYFSYAINEVIYKGEKRYHEEVIASAKGNIIELKILNKVGDVMDTLTFDAKDPRCMRVNKEDGESTDKTNHRSVSDEELAGCGSFILKVSDILSVKISRLTSQHPNTVYVTTGASPSEPSKSVDWSLSSLSQSSVESEPDVNQGKVEGSEAIDEIRQAEAEEAEREEYEEAVMDLFGVDVSELTEEHLMDNSDLENSEDSHSKNTPHHDSDSEKF